MSPMTAKLKLSGAGARSAQPASASVRRNWAPAFAGVTSSLIREVLQPVQRLHRLARRELVGIERGELAAQRVLRGGGLVLWREEVVLGAGRTQLLLQLGQVLARRAHDVLGNAGEVRHVDAVGAV